MPSLRKEIREAGQTWSTLTIYGRFEHTVVLILTVLIAIVIVAATFHFATSVVSTLFSGDAHLANQDAFQGIFGMILTVLIALEFEYSLLVALAHHESIVRLRTVIIIAMLAIVRKFIVIEVDAIAAEELFGLSTAILALGIVHWLVRDQDRRQEQHNVKQIRPTASGDLP
jgi:uncharacterized membrane protein (DUF373 family)